MSPAASRSLPAPRLPCCWRCATWRRRRPWASPAPSIRMPPVRRRAASVRALGTGNDVIFNERITTEAERPGGYPVRRPIRAHGGAKFGSGDRRVRLLAGNRYRQAGGECHQGRVPVRRRRAQQEPGCRHHQDTCGHRRRPRRRDLAGDQSRPAAHASTFSMARRPTLPPTSATGRFVGGAGRSTSDRTARSASPHPADPAALLGLLTLLQGHRATAAPRRRRPSRASRACPRSSSMTTSTRIRSTCATISARSTRSTSRRSRSCTRRGSRSAAIVIICTRLLFATATADARPPLVRDAAEPRRGAVPAARGRTHRRLRRRRQDRRSAAAASCASTAMPARSTRSTRTARRSRASAPTGRSRRTGSGRSRLHPRQHARGRGGGRRLRGGGGDGRDHSRERLRRGGRRGPRAPAPDRRDRAAPAASASSAPTASAWSTRMRLSRSRRTRPSPRTACRAAGLTVLSQSGSLHRHAGLARRACAASASAS